MSALDDLIAAVEAPDTNWYHFPELCENAFGECARTESIRSAYMGSLDAGLGLHEALLPGWDWLVRRSGWCSLHSPDFESITWEAGECVKTDILSGMNVVVGDVPFPARAWLLAILRALKAQEGRE